MSENLNEVFTIDFADSEVITVPIDDTLSISLDAGKVTVRRRSLPQPVVLDIAEVKKRASKTGIELW